MMPAILNSLMARCSIVPAIIVIVFSIIGSNAAGTDAFQDLTRPPDTISVVTEIGPTRLSFSSPDTWSDSHVVVTTRKRGGGLVVRLSAPTTPVISVKLHWNALLPKNWKYLGDAWERAYGDLEWKRLDGHRILPWYFLATNGKLTHGYGVKTGPAALCYWVADDTGITLFADVRCGGSGVQLGSRKLHVCTIICRRGKPDETPFAAAQSFCGLMCPKPRLPKQPVFGFNDWYYSYGKDTADEFLKNVKYMVSLAPAGGVRPYAVVDDGWEENPDQTAMSNLWDRVNPLFSTNLNMPELAECIKAVGARPGLWCRPLIATPDCPKSWRLSRDTNILDPSVPEVRTYVKRMISQFRKWGFQMIKHDYTTYDLLGRWGFEMGSLPTTNGWAFADRSRTTAEIIRSFYQDIRDAAGDGVLIEGCDTIGHLSAGIFEMQRIGDDTSGRDWNRTRKMGINSLAFRAPQQGSFFAVDADCAGQTTADSVPWNKNSQWLALLSQSGTVLFTSFPRDIIGPEQAEDLRHAFRAASHPAPVGEPLDWLDQRTPMKWRLNGAEVHFDW